MEYLILTEQTRRFWQEKLSPSCQRESLAPAKLLPAILAQNTRFRTIDAGGPYLVEYRFQPGR
jgi:hypothetical protein